MKTFIINTTIVCQFLFPCIALEANSLISAFNHKTEQLNAPVVATFWGGFKRFKIFDNNQGNVLQFKTKLFLSGHIDIYLRKVSSQKLIIFMPGIFGSIQEGLTPPMIDQLEQANANLLVIPNLLSSDYITAYPLYESHPIS